MITKEPIIEARDIYRFYRTEADETLALRGVSLRVDAGEIVALIGPSGSGKSTLLACLAGLDEPDGGYVVLDGRRLTRRPEAERAARRAAEIGILLQSGNLFEHLSVAENVSLAMRVAGRHDEPKIQALLAAVGLRERQRARPSQLSGGEAARAGLAVAIANDPKVLLADEPTGEVDPATETLVLDLFGQRRARGGATIIATHSSTMAARADRIVRLHDGRIIDG